MSLRAKPAGVSASRLEHVLRVGCVKEFHKEPSSPPSVFNASMTDMMSKTFPTVLLARDARKDDSQTKKDVPVFQDNTFKTDSLKKIVKNDAFITLDYVSKDPEYKTRDEVISIIPSIGGAIYMKATSNPQVLASNFSVLMSNADVLAVKMLGFSSVVKFADPDETYKKAVQTLLDGSDGVKGLKQIIADREEKNAEPLDLVLYFDGDPSAEKTESKMCHSIFAPMVARLLGEALMQPVHLLIIKIHNGSINEMFNEFADYEDNDNAWKVRTSLDGDHSQPVAFYPGVDRAVFQSCGLVVQESNSAETSEASVLQEVMQDRVKVSACLCVGGDTESSVQAMIDASEFDLAVRINAHHIPH